jgi:hypothetical protein
MSKISVTIIAHNGEAVATCVLEADVQWLALDLDDIGKMARFRVGTIDSIEVQHDNGSFLWPYPS